MSPSAKIRKRAAELATEQVERIEGTHGRLPLNEKRKILRDIKWTIQAILEHLDSTQHDFLL